MEYGHSESPKNWMDKSSAAAPTLLGLAAGILVGDMMHRGARRPIAFSLACLGVAALTPTVVDAVKNKVAGPNTKRGSRRTLEGIRDAGVSAEDEFGEEMYSG